MIEAVSLIFPFASGYNMASTDPAFVENFDILFVMDVFALVLIFFNVAVSFYLSWVPVLPHVLCSRQVPHMSDPRPSSGGANSILTPP